MQVGNALTDDYHDHLGVFQFMWAAGLISDKTYGLLNLLCDFQSFIHTSDACDNILDVANEELGNIDPYSIFTPTCPANVSQSNRLLKRMNVSYAEQSIYIYIISFLDKCCTYWGLWKISKLGHPPPPLLLNWVEKRVKVVASCGDPTGSWPW